MQNRAVERTIARCVLPFSGSASEQFLACKGALDVSSHDLDGDDVVYSLGLVVGKKSPKKAKRWCAQCCCRARFFW